MTHETEHPMQLPIPPALVAQIQAAADEQHRAPEDVLRDAVELYLRASGPPVPEKTAWRSPAEAAARMRRSRMDNALLDDVALRDLMTHGRT